MTLSMHNSERSKQKSAVSIPQKLLNENSVEKKTTDVETRRGFNLTCVKTSPLPNKNCRPYTGLHRKFTDLDPDSRLHDSHRVMSLLKMSMHETSNLPPIVQKQIRKSLNDPYIKKVRFFSIPFFSNELSFW
jgi:hypothetical protein